MPSLASVRDGSGPTVVLVHGFTQTHASMAALGSRLGEVRTVAVDLPGHGGSSGVSADLDETAALAAAAAEDEPFVVVGYSLGGRVALHVACQAPAGLLGVVAISASPGIRDADARERRRERDVELADALEADGDVDAFLSRWLANPLFATLPAAAADVDARRENTAAGLADSLRRCSVGTQRWLGDELVDAAVPVQLVCGARDDPFVTAACALAGRGGAVDVAVVTGAGHVAHLEQPELTARLVRARLPR
jgi:2-succinyl-6-hydroxy-2,4-cyclohexadiene-1-carboxylate synthase